jgi:uncharacterized damage-inducible protein DinB
MWTVAQLKELGDFSRKRTLELLSAVERSGRAQAALAFRPGPNRAPLAWQFMHIAASDQRFLHFRLQGVDPPDLDFNARYAHGSTPTDETPTLAEIAAALELHRARIWRYVDGLTPEQLAAVPPRHPEAPGDTPVQPVFAWLTRLAWHEAHHHGQAHVTFNIFKATNGLL